MTVGLRGAAPSARKTGSVPFIFFFIVIFFYRPEIDGTSLRSSLFLGKLSNPPPMRGRESLPLE